jgi:hypothetical protein
MLSLVLCYHKIFWMSNSISVLGSKFQNLPCSDKEPVATTSDPCSVNAGQGLRLSYGMQFTGGNLVSCGKQITVCDSFPAVM